ncbi:polysaccharide deacetylase family protein [uncultured Desulfobulbus sp.]|uniref:polysaccharide deacetylase family protein n=1 Tax=uncultured Desulfobulbus sp. TaxID=239745 RepID=UPI0029C75011|nr:polysaccharide deacetylase family protein [uncultured Desulfobulbus sp.]
MNQTPLGTEPSPPLTADSIDSRDSFVFLDKRGKRWPRFRRLMFAGGLLFFIATILFIQTLVLPSYLVMPPAVEQLKSRIKALQEKKMANNQMTATKPLWLDYAKKHKSTTVAESAHDKQRHQPDSPPKKESMAMPPDGTKEIRLGFYESWDPDSFDSLKANAEKLTHLCPDWLTFDAEIGHLKIMQEEKILDLVKEQDLVLMPLLRNLGEADVWMAEAVEGLINGPVERQEQFIAHLTVTLSNMQAGGVVLDWQQVDPSYRGNMSTFLARIADALHRENMELWLCVSTGRDLKIFDLDVLSQHIDRFVAMLHDEHAELDPPGPIASQQFFNGWLSSLVDGYGKPSQWVISQGSYGYDWTEGQESAELISFPDVMSRAGRSAQASSDFHRPSLNPHFVYGEGNSVHTVWFLDAITFLNQLTAARAHHVGGIAVNRLGTEDPGIWDVLDFPLEKPPHFDDLARLEIIRPGEAIAHIGKGNLITIVDERSEGNRRIQIDKKAAPGAMASATYEKFPSYLTILHQGQGAEDGVTITFDDGPDSEWTPQILDILKAKNVKATFFMIGSNMENHPKIVRRILAEGHMIGVHTYSHPNIALVSEERAHLEFNATQRLIESITGHSTIIFRPPYNADTNPHDAEELVPIKLAQAMGYVSVTEDIDPEDWEEPGVKTMLERVKRGRMRGGNVVLLHDAGGDRSQTVEVLPQIIDYLTARGDRILPLPQLLEIPAEQLMPVLPASQQPLTRMISESGFTAIHEVTNFFWAFMIVATGLTILKTLAVSWLAIRSRRDDEAAVDADETAAFCPPISVLIAAYNEEKVIGDTLRSVLNTLYSGPMEVIVVDDGSQDATAAIVTTMAKDDPRIRLIRQNNLGKANALRNGLQAVTHQFVVSLDADTQFTPQTIGHLIQPFADPAVGAVSGRARVGNSTTLFARFQSLEYTCGFNLDRRAYHQLNCITVVPGAVSALRVEAINKAGGISTETLAEDTDLTLALHKCGYAIHYAPRAVAWTEAPETMRTFAKQRFRWAFGTLQCLWKHRELLFNPHYKALGWFSLPSAWFFNIFLVAFGSIIDLLLLLSLVVSPANSILYFYFFVFLAADLVLAAVACLVEREPLFQIWLVLPMRFIYRPVLNIVVVRAILRALKGVWVGWGKLDRTASVLYRA